MKPLTKKKSVSPKSSSKKAPLPGISAKSRSFKPGCKTRTPPRSRQYMKKASVRGLAVPDKTSNQTSVATAQHGLDQLALISAILLLISAVIGVYIALKTLSLPGSPEVII
ncbi:hypothetical protein ACFTRD_19125 [Paenibacillus sp. NPDC056933]|uniref:hypothetical protein n=1 Tax=Paenibacillus sp. NPDC056933 TaxID=3345968 RepID=UPI0036349035